MQLPEDPSTIQPRAESIEFLTSFAKTVSSELLDAKIEKKQACYLPCSIGDGIPLIGEVPGTNNSLFIATGHSCWGILNAPATGLCMAELIMDGKSGSVNLSPFDPKRFNK